MGGFRGLPGNTSAHFGESTLQQDCGLPNLMVKPLEHISLCFFTGMRPEQRSEQVHCKRSAYTGLSPAGSSSSELGLLLARTQTEVKEYVYIYTRMVVTFNSQS